MWTTLALRTGMAALVLFSVWLTPWGASRTKDVAAADSASAHEFRTKADASLTEWALARFEQAGLELPPVSIAFHDDKEPCHGNLGFYRSGSPALIDICGFNWDRFVPAAKHTLLHELGHAWTQHTLTGEDRQGFLTLRHLATWGDDRFEWSEQGSEQAAEIIAWALIDQDVQLAIGNASPDALAQAYMQLTGSLPLTRVRVALDQHGAW
jgi:hypothetical protein